MKEDKKVILNVLKKNVERDDKFENLVLNLAIRKMNGAKKDERGVYYSKNAKHVVMATKTLEGEYAIAEGTEEIDDNAFWGCAFVTKITIPDSVTTIGREAFGRCISLADLVIPKSVTKISTNPFVDLDVDNVKCLSENYTIDSKILYNAERTKLIACLTNAAMCIIPKGVVAIQDYAFTRRRNLKKVVIPEGVKSIGADAFSDCDALEEVVIPATVTNIDNYAFAECDKLRLVTFLSTVKHLSRTAFSDCDSLRSLSVPAGTASKFRKQLHVLSDTEMSIREREEKPKKKEPIAENVPADGE